MTRAVALVLAAAAVALGCGGSDDDEAGDRTETVERTRVEVLERGDGEGGTFDAEALYRETGPGVVTIVSIFNADERSEGNRLPIDPGGDDEDDGGGGEPNGGVGSGFVVSGEGEIATNAHVVTTGEGNDIKRADQVYVRFADHNQVEAKIVGFDPNADIALLKLETREGLRLRPLPLGRTNDVRVGAPVIAIGSPFGEEQSLSVGVVSATDRAIQSLTGFDTLGAVQTDAAINQGNSGGPLIDADGEVIGVNAQIRTRSGGGEGVGYAIPVDQVRRSVEQIREDGEVRYAYLGVATTAVYPQLSERFDLGTKTGALVQEVVKGGPADKAGLKAGTDEVRFQARPYRRGGDVITRVDDTPVRTETDLGIAVARYEPGAEVTLEIVRDGRRREVKARLGERPAETGQRRP